PTRVCCFHKGLLLPRGSATPTRACCFHMGCAATSWVVLLPQGLGCYHRVWVAITGFGLYHRGRGRLWLLLWLLWEARPRGDAWGFLGRLCLPFAAGAPLPQGPAAPTRVCCSHKGLLLPQGPAASTRVCCFHKGLLLPLGSATPTRVCCFHKGGCSQKGASSTGVPHPQAPTPTRDIV
ncbi:hypothetical protein SAMN05216280_101712, partial [Ectopseudomonas oleovorans]